MNLLLRAEQACLMAGFAGIYFYLGYDWKIFAVMFFTPDLSFIGYAGGPKVGNFVYNFAHNWVVAAFMLAVGVMMGWHLLIALALIKSTHICFDRMLGFGLKFDTDQRQTHLGNPDR